MFDNIFSLAPPVIERINLSTNLTDQAYTFHLHPNAIEMVYIASGMGTYMINNQNFSVMKGDFLVIENNLPHAGSSSHEHPVKTLVIVISGLHWKEGAYRDHLIPPASSPLIRAAEHMSFISGAFAELYRLKKADYPNEELYPMILTPVLLLLRGLCRDNPPIWEIRTNPTANAILDYIYTHYTEDITLEHLSRHFYMSDSHINHLLQREFHISPINYLIDVRFSKAKGLLINSDMSIADVAYSVGYNNPAHFTKLFIKRIGYTPQEYRSIHENLILDRPAVPDIFK